MYYLLCQFLLELQVCTTNVITSVCLQGKGVSSSVIEVEVEPSVLAVGPYHLVCSMNNRAWLYDLSRDSEPTLMSCREYIGTVSAVCLNAEYTATLLGTRIHLHYVSVRAMTILKKDILIKFSTQVYTVPEFMW